MHAGACMCVYEELRPRPETLLLLHAQFTAVLAGRGVAVKPFVLNYTTPAADIILAVMASEAAANFDYWQRSGAEDTNRRQDFWPPLLRLARMIPAVEYIQVPLSCMLTRHPAHGLLQKICVQQES
jgi:hypothetical protein